MRNLLDIRRSNSCPTRRLNSITARYTPDPQYVARHTRRYCSVSAGMEICTRIASTGWRWGRAPETTHGPLEVTAATRSLPSRLAQLYRRADFAYRADYRIGAFKRNYVVVSGHSIRLLRLERWTSYN